MAVSKSSDLSPPPVLDPEMQALQLRLQGIVHASEARRARATIREAAAMVRKAEKEMRSACALLWPKRPIRPEAPSVAEMSIDAGLVTRGIEFGSFRYTLVEAHRALQAASRAIPACAPAGKVRPDSIDKAPPRGRLKVELRRAALRSNPKMGGAELRDLLRSIGQEVGIIDDVDSFMSRKRQDEAKRRLRRKKASPRVKTTVRRKK